MRREVRLVLLAAAVIFTVAAIAIESQAAAASCVALLLVGRKLRHSTRTVWQVMSAAVLVVVVLGLSAEVQAQHDGIGVRGRIVRALPRLPRPALTLSSLPLGLTPTRHPTRSTPTAGLTAANYEIAATARSAGVRAQPTRRATNRETSRSH